MPSNVPARADVTPSSADPLPPDALHRYARQLALPEFGLEGQQRLARGRVLVVGAGGLGSPIAMWCVAAGVGRVGLVDPDVVDTTNLHRQLLYTSADVGRRKVEAARERLRAVNPHVTVDAHPVALDSRGARALVREYDIVVDATDSLAARYVASDACVLEGRRPLVHGSVSRFEGRVTTLVADGAPCWRCLYPTLPPRETVPTCAENGVLGVVPGVVGMLQATEVLKRLAGLGTGLAGRMVVFDGLGLRTIEFALRPDPLCPACGTGEIREVSDVGAAAPCGREAVRASAVPAFRPSSAATGAPSAAPRAAPPSSPQQPPAVPPADPTIPEITPTELAERLRAAEPPVLIDVREPWEHGIAHIAGARLVPLNSLPAALSTFDPSLEYVVHCHHGVRSLMAAQFLKERGLQHVTNLTGGIDRWSDDVDPTVPKY